MRKNGKLWGAYINNFILMLKHLIRTFFESLCLENNRLQAIQICNQFTYKDVAQHLQQNFKNSKQFFMPSNMFITLIHT